MATHDSVPDCEVLNTARLGVFDADPIGEWGIVDARPREYGTASLNGAGSSSPASSCFVCRARHAASASNTWSSADAHVRVVCLTDELGHEYSMKLPGREIIRVNKRSGD